MLREWAESLMAKVKGKDKTFIYNKKFSRIFQIVDNCLEYAADEDIAIISENPWPKVSKSSAKNLSVLRVHLLIKSRFLPIMSVSSLDK